MNSSDIERAAYIAAYRLLTTDLTAPELACPGARRSALTDNMAAIIKDVYETELSKDLIHNARPKLELVYTGI